MLQGVEYLTSTKKATFDRRFGNCVAPLTSIAALGARATFGYSIYSDQRVGQNELVYATDKIQTLNESGQPIDRAAELFRKFGLDETLQLAELSTGTLSVVGRRRLTVDEYELMRNLAQKTNEGRDLLAEWDDMVLPFKCGYLSSYSLEAHAEGSQNVERRLTLDIADSHAASLRNDVRLVAQAVKSMATGKLKEHSVPIHDTDFNE